MSAAPRLRAGTILVLAAFAVLPIVGLVPSCGTGAVGVDACRSIESARCDALVSCPKEQHGLAEDQVAACKLFYRDDCLHGIENNDAGADVVLTDKDACVKAIAATAVCAKAGAKTMDGCAGATLVMTANASAVSPCDMLAGSVVDNSVRVAGVELLKDCNFVLKVDGGATSSASSSSGSSSSAAGGGASSSSSTSSASASSSTSSASSSSASSSAAGGGGGPGDASPE